MENIEVKCSPNTMEMMYGIFASQMDRLKVTVDYTIGALRDVIDTDKTVLKIWGLCINLMSDILSMFSYVKQLGDARKSSLEYDFYNEIRNYVDEMNNRLTALKQVCFVDKEKELLYYAFNHHNNIDIMRGINRNMREYIVNLEKEDNNDYEFLKRYWELHKELRKKYTYEQEFNYFLEYTEADVITQLSSLPVYLETLIDLLKELTMLQYERSEKDLLLIYEKERNEYEKNVFANKWTGYLSQLKKTTFRFKPMTSSSLQDVYYELCKTLQELPLGKVYLDDYDTEEKRAYEYNRLQRRHKDWELFFYTSLKYEYLCELINQKIEEENGRDPEFKSWVDLIKLEKYLFAWIKANIQEQYQWTAVICIFHELGLLRNTCNPETLCNRLNILFPDADKPCKWESIRKDIGKKWDSNKECNKPVSTWSESNRLRPLAIVLYKKMSDKAKYTKSEEE